MIWYYLIRINGNRGHALENEYKICCYILKRFFNSYRWSRGDFGKGRNTFVQISTIYWSFGEHLILLCECVGKNIPSVRKHWNNILTADAKTTNTKKKAMVRGFLKLWKENRNQLFYPSLMIDLLRLFEKFQKDGQNSMITL